MDFIRLTLNSTEYSNMVAYVSANEISHFQGSEYTGSVIYLKRDNKCIHVSESPDEIYKALEEMEDARLNEIFGTTEDGVWYHNHGDGRITYIGEKEAIENMERETKE